MIFGYNIDFCNEPSLSDISPNLEIEIHDSALSSHSRTSRKTIAEPTGATQILHKSLEYEHSAYSKNPISRFGISQKISADKTIRVQCLSLPHFGRLTMPYPHSLQQVRYGFHQPMGETKGKHVEWMMEVQRVLKLVWFPGTQTIGYEKLEGYAPERLRFWVYHTFLPLLFQMEDIYHILHAGSVEVEGKAVIFMAPSFGGKSTLTDYFLQKGHRLLSDDTLAIDTQSKGVYRAVASWPFHRPYREAETLGEETVHFVTSPLEIAAVFRLEKSDAGDAIAIEAIQGVEKFKTVHYGTFIPLSFLKERRFAFHAAFAKAVPVYCITIPWKRERLDEVYRSIVAQVRRG